MEHTKSDRTGTGRVPVATRWAGRQRGAAAPGSDALARARVAFLGEGSPPPEVVREPILASWTRSRLFHVPTERLEVPYDADADRDTVLTRAAEPVLRDAAARLADEPVSAILCDASGTVLRRQTADTALARHLDQVWLAPGFSYAEQHVGTNGIGTALEGQAPARVFGHEHYVEHLEDLACAGVPVRHPLTGRTVGVIDLTCWRRDAGAAMTTVVAALAAGIEEQLLEQSGRRELALLQDYLATCRRSRGAVLAVGRDLLMLNDRARELLAAGDQGPLVEEVLDALAQGARRLVVGLPSGLTVRVACRPTFRAGRRTDGVVHVQPLAALQAVAVPVRPPLPSAPVFPTLAGSAAPWTKCCSAADRHARAREWLVLEGEPGTGKTAVARAAHDTHTPEALLRVLDADAVGPQGLADAAEALGRGGGSLVLTHVERLTTESRNALVRLLEPHRAAAPERRPWVVATRSLPGPSGGADLGPLLTLFPHTVAVPPLRHHVEDVADLVPHLLERLSRGSSPSVSPAALGVLLRNRWPGNVRQLGSVLQKVLATRRSGVVDVRDLPPECSATTRRVLTPVEALECDAVVAALEDSGGNKAEAARLLGLSRATVYRKIHEYGIVPPQVTTPPGGPGAAVPRRRGGDHDGPARTGPRLRSARHGGDAPPPRL